MADTGICCATHHLAWHGGKGYGYVLATFGPLLHAAGLSEEDVHALLVKNPRRAFSYSPPTVGSAA
jgi:phosphotriesterase-related protein